MPSRESQREELDRLAGFEGVKPRPDDSNPLWAPDPGMFYIGGGRYLTIHNSKIKRLIKEKKLKPPPVE